jgi:hypothetical protein
VANAVAGRLLCAAALADSCSSDPALVAAYGPELAGRLADNAPEIVYEAGMTALPVDFRSCRWKRCANGPDSGPVWASDSGAPTVAFVHAVDCRTAESRSDEARRGSDCSGERAGNLYIQYWLYYEDSSSLKDLQPVIDPLGVGAFHEDDWESYQVRVGDDGRVESRASSHNSYNYDGGVAAWPSDAGLFPRSAWGPCTGRTFVSGGSHAGHVDENGDPHAGGGRRHGDAPLPASGALPSRWTPADHLRLIPIETLPRRARTVRFAVVPPWRKFVYFDPEWKGT